MIYDTFLYDGEEEMLSLRIATLKDVIDVFLPITGTRTFRGIKKPSIPWHPGLPSHLVEIPSFTDPWLAEQWHRNDVLASMQELQPEDIVLIGDVDEIPDPENVTKLGAHEMEFYQYDALRVHPQKWIGTVGMSGRSILDGMLPSVVRMNKDRVVPRIQGGWHLSYFFMDPVRIAEKIRSFSHSEFDRPEFTDLESILTRMNQGLDLFDRGPDFDCVRLEEPSDYLPPALKASRPGRGKAWEI